MKWLSFENTGKQNVCKLFGIYSHPRLKGENVENTDKNDLGISAVFILYLHFYKWCQFIILLIKVVFTAKKNILKVFCWLNVGSLWSGGLGWIDRLFNLFRLLQLPKLHFLASVPAAVQPHQFKVHPFITKHRFKGYKWTCTWMLLQETEVIYLQFPLKHVWAIKIQWGY